MDSQSRRHVPGIPIERLKITRKLMNDALPDATVTGYRTHLEAVALPDPDDRHVVAAAIAAGASVILTWNLRDFPTRELKKHGLSSHSCHPLSDECRNDHARRASIRVLLQGARYVC